MSMPHADVRRRAQCRRAACQVILSGGAATARRAIAPRAVCKYHSLSHVNIFSSSSRAAAATAFLLE
jgi:hypothetical protein